jgi:gamma-glutamylcyclotransferase
MLYFAYGSNMDWEQMRSRCPSAKFITKALLPKHCLRFTRASKKRECGVSDVVPDKSESVWGVVFEISDLEIALLDKEEGFRPGRNLNENSYVREERHVLKEGDETQPLLVSVYFGIPQENPPLPNADYKSLLLNGADQWKLPKDYILKLEAIKTA